MDSFDPYHKWLGIPKKEQPANHYRLLGVTVFETDLEVIEAAADRQMAYVSQCAIGEHQKLSQQILNELSAARVCLLVAAKKAAYDAQLRKKLDPPAAASANLSVPISTPESAGDFDQTFETLRPQPRRKKTKSRKAEIPSWMLAGAGVAAVVLVAGLWSILDNGRSAKSGTRSDLEAPPVTRASVAPAVESNAQRSPARTPVDKPTPAIVPVAKPESVVSQNTEATNSLEVLEARYGAFDRWSDLTDRARAAAQSGFLGMVVDGGLVGGDPYPGVQKNLELRYRLGGRDYEYLAPDFHSTFVIDARRKPAVDPAGQLIIHEAWYGGNISGEDGRIDVVDRLRTAVHDGRLQVNLAQVVEGLPNRRILFIRWSVQGQVWSSPFELDETIDLGPETLAVSNLASRGASKTDDGQSLLVLEAKYGRGNQWMDLTEKVRFTEKKGVIAFLADGSTAMADPVPNVPKMMRVRYQAGGMLYDQVYFGGSFVYFDARTDQTPVTGSGLKIIQAICGHGVFGDPREAMIDVTDHLQKQVRDDRLVQSFDAALGEVTSKIDYKRLLIRYAYKGQVRIVVLNQGGEIRLGAE